MHMIQKSHIIQLNLDIECLLTVIDFRLLLEISGK